MQTRQNSTTKTILGLVILLVIIWGIFIVFKSIFNMLAWAAPFLFIAALIINHKVVLSYGKMLITLLQKNTVMGIIALLLTIFTFPIVAAILLGLAIMNKKAEGFMEQERQKRDGIPTDFREISSMPTSEYDELLRKK